MKTEDKYKKDEKSLKKAAKRFGITRNFHYLYI